MSEADTPEAASDHAQSKIVDIMRNWHEGKNPRYYEFEFDWFKTDAKFDKKLITNAFGEGTKYRRSATPRPMPCTGSSYKLETRVQEHMCTISMPSKPRGKQTISTKGNRDFFIRCTVACIQRAADAPKSLQRVLLDPVVWDERLVNDIVQLFRSNHRFQPPLSFQSSDEYTGAPRPTQP
eukprot:2173626-Rhodomonas_salina.1